MDHPPSYPAAPPGPAADVLHGRTVADPYRWLEDPTATETLRWAAEQDELFARWRAGEGPEAAASQFRTAVRRLLPGSVGLPAARGVRLFFERRRAEDDHPVLHVRGPDGDRALLDPNGLSADHTITLDGWWPSKDGARVAYVVSEGGTEEQVLSVIEVDSGERVDGPVVCGRAADLAWLADGESYLYVRRLPDGRRPDGEEQFHRRVWRRRIGTPLDADECVFGDGGDKTAYYGVGTSPDGRWATVSVSLGTAPRNDLYVAAVGGPGDRVAWTAAQEGVDALAEATIGPDGRLYVLTNRDAPRYRLAVADPARPAAEHWRDLVPEGDAVLEGFTVLTDTLVTVVRRDVVNEVELRRLADGAPVGRLDLPGLGSATVTSRAAGGTDLWVAYTDYTTPPVVLHADLAARPTSPGHGVAAVALVPSDGPEGAPAVELAGIRTIRVSVPSTGGVEVPLFIVADGDAAGPRPTVLYGYGGFNIALAPAYSAVAAAWVAAGGVWAVANLRGGSEYGESWHRAGMRADKQNVFDDFSACARWLVDARWAGPGQLGIYGGSNGGLLVGAAMTQWPARFDAVVCSAPLLDMVRYERFGLGVTWNDEYGTADDPTELGWLLGYSPYHHVVAGTAYPPTLFTVFDADTRVDPLHARKMCAAVQAATSAAFADAPVLLRREAQVGHSTRSVGRTVELAGDVLAFLATQLGLVVAPAPGPSPAAFASPASSPGPARDPWRPPAPAAVGVR